MPDDDRERIKSLIERNCATMGFSIESWEDGEDGLIAHLAGEWEILVDDEDRGLFSGDTGTLSVSIVGAQQYQNERPALWFVPEGQTYDSGEEVQPDDVESA